MANTVTVKPGDTLSQIAKAQGVKVSDISGYRSGNPNLIYPGETLTLSNIGNSIPASEIKPPINVNLPTQNLGGTNSLFPTSSSDSGGINNRINKYRSQLEKMINTRQSEVDTRLADLRQKETDTLGQAQTLTTPFRQDLEIAQREKLHINKNFEENQTLINELDSLLTQGNDLIKQQKEVTGLSAIRNPRVQKTMNDVASRAGVIEAVINARNGQVSVAENMIDRSVNAIAADRQDQLSYYKTVLNLNNRDILSLDKESKKLADSRISLIENDLTRAQATADYVKKLMIDPATAALVGEAGVSLNDSVEKINSKLQNAQSNRDLKDFSNKIGAAGGVSVVSTAGIPADQLRMYTDANGGKHYYKMPNKSSSGGTGSTGFNSALNRGRSDLERGYDWGQVWNRIKNQFPDVSNDQIDNGLGLEWKKAGAFERFKNKTNSAKPSLTEQQDISVAKQALAKNDGSTEDMNKVETDSNFRAWVLSNY